MVNVAAFAAFAFAVVRLPLTVRVPLWRLNTGLLTLLVVEKYPLSVRLPVQENVDIVDVIVVVLVVEFVVNVVPFPMATDPQDKEPDPLIVLIKFAFAPLFTVTAFVTVHVLPLDMDKENVFVLPATGLGRSNVNEFADTLVLTVTVDDVFVIVTVLKVVDVLPPIA
jgi:hypothetical protein